MIDRLSQFVYCPKCGSSRFIYHNVKSHRCEDCGFVYYLNPSAAVAIFIRNQKGELLVATRAKEPAKGSFDLPGGFADFEETIEQAAIREVKEEAGLDISNLHFLFSLPNNYEYSGFVVPTMDLFFETEIADDAVPIADDDVETLSFVPLTEISPEAFGLESVKKAVCRYLSLNN